MAPVRPAHVDAEGYFSNIRHERRTSETEFVVVRDLDGLTAGAILIAGPRRDGGMRRCRRSHRSETSFLVPDDALEPYVRTWEATCYMPHDPSL